MATKISQLSVIEGKWSEKTNISVKGLFDTLSDINHQTPHSYTYEMFCDAHALNNIIHRMGLDREIKYIYIGAHGSERGILGSGGDVSRTQLRNTILELNTGSIDGLFLGSCLFGHEENASFLLTPQKFQNPPIKWVAGYKESIDWIDSSVLDLLFWNKFFSAEGSPIEKINSTADQIKYLAPGLAASLGFSIYTRRGGPNGGIQNLMDN